MEKIKELCNYSIIHIPTIIIFIFTYHRYKKYNLAVLDRRTNTNNSFVIKYSKQFGYIGLFCMLGMVAMLSFLIMMSESVFFQTDFIDYFVWGGFEYLCLYIFYVSLMKKAVVKKNIITVYPLLGKPFIFTFNDITSVKRGVKPNKNRSEWITIKTNKGKRFQVDSLSYEYDKYYDKILSLTKPTIRQGFKEDNIKD